MNKKFLSAILFGALMVTSTGTFVSCKDYDDDIDNLQTQIDANESAIAELKALIQNSDYVTGVTVSGSNLIVNFKNAGAQTIALPEDQKGSLVTVDGGVLYIDGVATDIKVCEGTTEEGEFLPAVKIDENGEWAVLQEDNTYKSTGVAVSSIAVAGNKTTGYVLTVTDAEGNKTEIELPTAASKITNLSLGENPPVWPVQLSTYKKWTLSGVITNPADWKGPKTLPANGSKVYVNIENPIDLRVDPVGLDATEFEYTLVSSKNHILPSFKMVAYGQSTWNVNGRAAYGNGLYGLNVEKFVVSGGQFAVDDFEATYADYVGLPYAVTANGSYRSEYAVDVQKQDDEDLDPALTQLAVSGADEYYKENGEVNYKNLSTTTSEWTVKVGSTNTINFNKSIALYDMYMTVEDKYIEPFGITWNDATRTFKVSKNPDSSSLKAGFPMTIYAVDNEGLVTKTIIQIKLSTVISSDCVYEAQSHDVSSEYNYFTIDLAKMKETISSDFEAWKLNVDLSKTQITMYYGMNASGLYTKVYPGTDPSMNVYDDNSDLFEYAITSAVTNDFSKVTSDADYANYIQIAINNEMADNYKFDDNSPKFVLDHTYYAKVVFFSNEGQLNTVIVPVKFTAPSLSELFTIKDAYVSDGAINAYFYRDYKNVELNKYFSASVSDATVELDGVTAVGATEKVSSYLGSLVKAGGVTTTPFAFGDSYAQLNEVDVKDGFEKGYGEAMIFNVAKDNYETWAYPVNRDGSCPNGSYTFKMRLMSPIMEGSIKPIEGSSIEISGNDLVNGAKITDAMIAGYDYNSNKYNVVPDAYKNGANAWANEQIKKVTAAADKEALIKSVEVKPVTYDTDGKKITANGYFLLKGESISNTKTVEMPVTVEDKWGYTMTKNVSVTIKKN